MSIVIDQSNVGEFGLDSSASTIALTTSNAVASGGFIVLFLTWVGNPTPTLSSVSGGGLTWSIDKTFTNTPAGSGLSGAIVSAQAPSGLASGTTITATLSGSTIGGRSLVASSWTGVASSTPVEQTINAANSSGVNWSSGSITTTNAGDLIVSHAITFDSNINSSPTSPSLELHDVNGGAGSFGSVVEYRIDASTGTYSNAGTWATSAGHTVYSVVYKAAAGGGTNGGVTAPAGAMTLAGPTATLTASGNVVAPAGAMTLGAPTALVSGSGRVTAPAGSLALAGPTATVSAGTVVTAPAGAMALSGPLASLIASSVQTAPAGLLALAGPQAAVGSGTFEIAPAGLLTLGANAPTIAYGWTVTAPSGALVMQGLAATIDNGTGTVAIWIVPELTPGLVPGLSWTTRPNRN